MSNGQHVDERTSGLLGDPFGLRRTTEEEHLAIRAVAPPTREERLAEEILELFGEHLSPLPLSSSTRSEIRAEAGPAVHALLFAIGSDRAADATSLEHHESVAMMTLLGRRVALLGATPSGALGIVPALVAAFGGCDVEIPASLGGALTAVLMEGFVRGREEAVDLSHRTSLAEATRGVEVAEGVWLLRVGGRLDADAITKIGEVFARRLFSKEARSCVVDVSTLEATTARHARAVLSIDESARMLGVRCVFTGFGERWNDTMADVDPPNATHAAEPGTSASTSSATLRGGRLVAERVEPFADALKTALRAADYRLTRTSWLPAPFRSLLP